MSSKSVLVQRLTLYGMRVIVVVIVLFPSNCVHGEFGPHNLILRIVDVTHWPEMLLQFLCLCSVSHVERSAIKCYR